mgnify:CR=1 FL=1
MHLERNGNGNNVTGRIIRDLRESKQMRQSQLAEQVGISQGGLAHWEKGRTEPSIRDLKKLAKALNTDLSVLTGSPTEGLAKIDFVLESQGVVTMSTVEQFAPKISIESDNEEFFITVVKSNEYSPTFWEGDILYARKRQVSVEVAMKRQLNVLVELRNDDKDKFVGKLTSSISNPEEIVITVPNNKPISVHGDKIKNIHPITWYQSNLGNL